MLKEARTRIDTHTKSQRISRVILRPQKMTLSGSLGPLHYHCLAREPIVHVCDLLILLVLQILRLELHLCQIT
jgi:hypothetical protein